MSKIKETIESIANLPDDAIINICYRSGEREVSDISVGTELKTLAQSHDRLLQACKEVTRDGYVLSVETMTQIREAIEEATK